MLFDKLRKRYSFYLLAIFGWLIFLSCIIPVIQIFLSPQPGDGDVFVIILFLLFPISCLTLSLSVICYFFEISKGHKITNEKITSNKGVLFLSILGIIFNICPILIFIYFFLLIKFQFNIKF